MTEETSTGGKTNQARRLLELLDLFLAMAHKRSVAHGVSRWFEGDAPESEPLEVAAAARRLSTVLEEIDRLESLLRAQDSRTFEGFIDHTGPLRKAVLSCLSGLQAAWANHAPNFAPADRTALKIWANALEDTEIVLDGTSLERLGEAIRELEHIARSDETPAALREVLLAQIGALRQAVVEYKLRGGKGFSDIVLQAAADLRRNASQVKSAPDATRSALQRVWKAAMDAIAPLQQGKETIELWDMAGRALKGVLALAHKD